MGRFVGGVFTVLGWMVLVLGGLFALTVGFFEIVGVGDHGPHFAWEDVAIPAAILALGAVLVAAGRALRPRPPPSVPPPG